MFDDNKQTNSDLKHPEDYLKEPRFSELVNSIRDCASKWMGWNADFIDSDEYKKIQKTIALKKKEGYESDEAEKAAWDDRKFLIRHIVENNLHLAESSSDEDEEVEQDDAVEDDTD